jgi:uncharacterized membrane protein YiaA
VPDHLRLGHRLAVAGRLPGLEQRVEHRVELLLRRVPRLEQVVVEVDDVDRLDRGVGVRVRGQQHPAGVREQVHRLLEELDAVHLRHPVVGQHHGDLAAAQLELLAARPAPLAGLGADDPVRLAVAAPQVTGDGPGHARIVVHGQLGIGLVGMALWRLSEAVFGAAGPDGGKAKKRLASAARAVFYGFVAYTVLSFAAGTGGSGSSDGKSRDATARAMDLPAGQWLVAAAGVGVLCAGVWMVVQAARRKYHKHMRLGEMSHRVRQTVDVTGVGGGVARGLVFAVAGGFALRAAVEYEPDKAKGMDDTLRSFTETPVGPWLLVLIAVGLMLFGLFSFAMARYRKV